MSVPSIHKSLLVDAKQQASAGQNGGVSPYDPGAIDTFGTRTLPIVFGTIAAALACITVILGIMQHYKTRLRDEERIAAGTMASSIPWVRGGQSCVADAFPYVTRLVVALCPIASMLTVPCRLVDTSTRLRARAKTF
jgi:hypothetical protein